MTALMQNEPALLHAAQEYSLDPFPLTFGYLRYSEATSNRVFVTVECLYGFKSALPTASSES